MIHQTSPSGNMVCIGQAEKATVVNFNIAILRSKNLATIVEFAKKAHKPDKLLNPYLFSQDFKGISDFKINIASAFRIQSSNEELSEGAPEHMVFCAPAVRNSTVTIVKRPSDGLVYVFHITPEHADWKRSPVAAQDFFELSMKDDSEYWVEDRSEMMVTTIMPSHRLDHFTKNSSLYRNYKAIEAFTLEYQQSDSTNDLSEAERFHVFYDTETEEILCINNRGEVSGPYTAVTD